MGRSLTLAGLAVSALVSGAMTASLAEQRGSWVMGSIAAVLVVLAFVLVTISNRVYDSGR